MISRRILIGTAAAAALPTIVGSAPLPAPITGASTITNSSRP